MLIHYSTKQSICISMLDLLISFQASSSDNAELCHYYLWSKQFYFIEIPFLALFDEFIWISFFIIRISVTYSIVWNILFSHWSCLYKNLSPISHYLTLACVIVLWDLLRWCDLRRYVVMFKFLFLLYHAINPYYFNFTILILSDDLTTFSQPHFLFPFLFVRILVLLLLLLLLFTNVLFLVIFFIFFIYL